MTALPTLQDTRIGLIGLGYVGLPLAVEFGKHFPTIGFDIKPDRVAELRAGRDSTRETTPEELQAANQLRYTTDSSDYAECNVYIVTVPIPIDRHVRLGRAAAHSGSREYLQPSLRAGWTRSFGEDLAP